MSSRQKILIFENSYTLTNFLIKSWTQTAQKAVLAGSRFSAALSGGRTPVEFYCRLSGVCGSEYWNRTHLFQADERYVPGDHPDNNFRMIQENLINYINIPDENIHPIKTKFDNVALCADSYKDKLLAFFGSGAQQRPCFDFILLGLGDDGHVASLFPEDPGVDDPDRWVLPVSLNHLKHERISLSFPVINNARSIYLIILGARKADIAKRFIEDKEPMPAANIQPAHGQLVVCLDSQAASLLAHKDKFVDLGDAISLG